MFSNISPAMTRYAQIEAGLNQGQDPISNGASKGIDAAKSSLNLTPMRINRPSGVGRGIASLAANMKTPQPGTGRAGMLESIANAMGPAMESYYGAQDQNNEIEFKLAEMQQKQLQDAEERQHRKDVLEETKRAHSLQYGDSIDIKREESELKKRLGDGVELFDKYPPNSRRRMAMEKDVIDWTDKANNAADAVRAIEGMRDIFARNRKLWGTVDIALLNKHLHDPNIINTLAVRAAIPKKDLADFQELATYAKELLVANSKDVAAKGLNVFMEKRMSAAIPDLNTVPEAANKMLDHLEAPHAFNYDVGTKKKDYASQGIYWRTPIKGKHEITHKYKAHEDKQPLSTTNNGVPDLSNVSQEELEAIIARESGQ